MKRILLALLLSTMCSNIFPHNLLFKGNKIIGNVWTFEANLKKQGFRHRANLNDGRVRMSGSYLGYANSDIYLNYSKLTENITFVQVTLSRPATLPIEGQFNGVLDALESKYGRARKATEFINTNSSICIDAVKWALTDGEIYLYIQNWEGDIDVGVQLRPFDAVEVNINGILQDM